MHEISNNVVCETSKVSDQPVHKRSLIKPLLDALVFYDCWATAWTSFGVYKLKMRLHRLVGVYTCQNATLLEITCTDPLILSKWAWGVGKFRTDIWWNLAISLGLWFLNVVKSKKFSVISSLGLLWCPGWSAYLMFACIKVRISCIYSGCLINQILITGSICFSQSKFRVPWILIKWCICEWFFQYLESKYTLCLLKRTFWHECGYLYVAVSVCVRACVPACVCVCVWGRDLATVRLD